LYRGCTIDQQTVPFWAKTNDKTQKLWALLELERVKGIEPSYSAWKAAALPLSYTRAPPINYHAMTTASTAMRRFSQQKRPLFR
jgi:hypothetical protein